MRRWWRRYWPVLSRIRREFGACVGSRSEIMKPRRIGLPGELIDQPRQIRAAIRRASARGFSESDDAGQECASNSRGRRGIRKYLVDPTTLISAEIDRGRWISLTRKRASILWLKIW